MKKCPYCHHNIPKEAKICPYCGHPQPGYSSRPNRIMFNKKMSLLILLCFAIPFLFSVYYTYQIFLETPTINESGEMIHLGKLGDASKNETVRYSFYSLDDLEKSVSDIDGYTNNINNFEKKIDQITKDSQYNKVDKEYLFQITNINNIYATIDYSILDKQNTEIQMRLYYDLSGLTKDVTLTKTQRQLKDFNEIRYQSDKVYLSLSSLVDSLDNTEIIEDNGKLFNGLENKFEERKETLGHYGLGYSKEKGESLTTMYVLQDQSNYRTRIKYETKLKNKQFIK